jgi:hypothetical protein
VTPLTPDEVIAALRATPMPVAQAMKSADKGGLPAEPGFYAWWAELGSMPSVPKNPHPTSSGMTLFYVGISPSSASSSQTIRSRVLNNHLRGNLGSSTFRKTLAALLLEELDLYPRETTTKVVLPKDENARLSSWQGKHLALTWCVTPQPWVTEPPVIAALGPPLNLASNAVHEFYPTLSEARRRLVEAAHDSGEG